MKNLYKYKVLAVLLIILCTLTSKQAKSQNQWGHTKEWKIHSMGEYTISAKGLDLDNSNSLFEERDSIILIGLQGVQPNKIPENTELPNYTQFVVGNQEVNDPIAIWSKKTKDFIKVKSNWTKGPLINPIFIQGIDKNTFFVFENNAYSSNPNAQSRLYRAKIIGDSIHYESLMSLYKHSKDDIRSICETEDKIVATITRYDKTVLGQDYYHYDSVYVYDSKNLNLIKAVYPFSFYRNCISWRSLVYDGKYFFLNAYQYSSGDFGVFILDLDVDTSCYIKELADPFNEIEFRNINGNIYVNSENNGLKKWNGSSWDKIVLPISIEYGFPSIDQFGNYFYFTDDNYKNRKGKYFNPNSATLYGEYKRDYLLYPQDGGIWVLNEEQQLEYYQKFGYTWDPIRVVSVGTDTFMFGWNNMVAKLVDRKNTSITDQETKTLLVYPNPANGFITVSTPIDATFTVTDITGKIVLTGNTNQTADVSTLNKGIYFVRIAGYTPTKLVIQ